MKGQRIQLPPTAYQAIADVLIEAARRIESGSEAGAALARRLPSEPAPTISKARKRSA